MIFTNVLVALTAAAVATAQSSTSSGAASIPSGLGITPCILACVSPAAQANGCNFADVQCVCSSAQFQVDAGACLQEHCTASDVTAALALQAAQCGAASITPTGTAGPPKSVSFTAPPSASTSASSNATTTRASATSSAPAASGSTTKASGANTVRVAWAGIALAGAAVGLAL